MILFKLEMAFRIVCIHIVLSQYKFVSLIIKPETGERLACLNHNGLEVGRGREDGSHKPDAKCGSLLVLNWKSDSDQSAVFGSQYVCRVWITDWRIV